MHGSNEDSFFPVVEKKAASWRAAEQQAVCAMAAEVHGFSPPEIPEPTLLENVLRYGLFFGAVFQLVCVLAIILPVSRSPETVSSALCDCHQCSEDGLGGSSV